MSFEQRNEYFCKAQTDMQMIYIEAEREVKQLKAENAKLRELMYERAHKHAIHHMTEDELRITAANVMAENAKLRDERDRMYKANVEKNGEILRLLEENAKLKQELEAAGTAAYLYGRNDLADENVKLREQTELLVTLLRNDCDIEASWDGLRRFWSIELTEDGCLMRDRACKAEAENSKLRELVRDLVTTVRGCGQDEDGYGQLPCEEVCPHWSNDGECTRLHRDQCWYEEQARELGIEVEG